MRINKSLLACVEKILFLLLLYFLCAPLSLFLSLYRANFQQNGMKKISRVKDFFGKKVPQSLR